MKICKETGFVANELFTSGEIESIELKNSLKIKRRL